MLNYKYEASGEKGGNRSVSAKREILPDINRRLLSFEEALGICLNETSPPLDCKIVPLLESWGRVLKEDISSKYYSPPFDKSMMDGYAVKQKDVVTATAEKPVKLNVIGETPAGSTESLKISDGEAVRIMTGAPMPKGADSVIKIEDTGVTEKDRVEILNGVAGNNFVLKKGRDFIPHQKIMKSGLVIDHSAMGMIANCGVSHVKVNRKPRIGIISTGNELAAPGESPGRGTIFDVNGYALCGLSKTYGAEPSYLGIARDNCMAVINTIHASDNWDILILSGGVSVGDYDVVYEALKKASVEEIFWRVKIKPGKPLFFGKKGKTLVFGLPGNPVSAITNFLMFIVPVIDKLSGKTKWGLTKSHGTVLNNCLLKPGRRKFLRGKLDISKSYQGVWIHSEQRSGVIRPLLETDVLMEIPDDVKYLKEGDTYPLYHLKRL